MRDLKLIGGDRKRWGFKLQKLLTVFELVPREQCNEIVGRLYTLGLKKAITSKLFKLFKLHCVFYTRSCEIS